MVPKVVLSGRPSNEILKLSFSFVSQVTMLYFQEKNSIWWMLWCASQSAFKKGHAKLLRILLENGFWGSTCSWIVSVAESYSVNHYTISMSNWRKWIDKGFTILAHFGMMLKSLLSSSFPTWLIKAALGLLHCSKYLSVLSFTLSTDVVITVTPW